MIEESINYKFKNGLLLTQALTHPSAKKNARFQDNERMEFLGDSILGFLISQKLYEKYPNEAEGALARRKAAIVCRQSLAEIAREINLGDSLILGHGEDLGGGRHNDANLENALEALMAAIYLDGGLEVVDKFINKFFDRAINHMVDPPKDPKSKLQEYLQGNGKAIPVYEIKSIDGPAHSPQIEVELNVDGHVLSVVASSKKKAERLAAEKMLEILNV